MITAISGQHRLALLEGAPTGIANSLRFRIVDPPATVVMPEIAGAVEGPTGVYSIEFDAPTVLTDEVFLAVWRQVDPVTGDTIVEATEEIQVAARATTRPDVDEVALLLRTRTVGESSGGLGGDTGPADVTTFTDTTRPTAAEVEAIVTTAHAVVLGRVQGDVPDDDNRRLAVRHAVALYAAIRIEDSFFRESTDAARIRGWENTIDEIVATTNEVLDEVPGGHARGSAVLDSMISPYDETVDLGWPAV